MAESRDQYLQRLAQASQAAASARAQAATARQSAWDTAKQNRLNTQPDPFLASKFWVEINSVTQGYFSECSGLKAEVEVTPLREGGTVAITQYMVGPAKWGNITLKRGWVDTNYLWDWFCKIASGKLDKRPISIIQFQNKGSSASDGYYRWNIVNAFPVKWSGPDWRVDGGAVAVETIELAHSGVSGAKV